MQGCGRSSSKQALGPYGPDSPIARLNPDGEMGTAVSKRGNGIGRVGVVIQGYTQKLIRRLPSHTKLWAKCPSSVLFGVPQGPLR